MLDHELSFYPQEFRRAQVSSDVLQEANNRVWDSIGCFYAAFEQKPGRLLRTSLLESVSGECSLWGTDRHVPAELAAWANGTCVRTLDYNDTYLSREPCHPSDMISSLWAACELSGSKRQGMELLKAMVLAYEVVCRLCDSNSLRKRGWDHVTYLPIATAVGCSYILGLNPEQTRHALALAMTGNNAMRQTRVGTISDWKAACASYAARAGLWAARMAAQGFTGPSEIFEGRHGFFNQVSGPFKLPKRALTSPWKIMDTHVKFYPAEHHAQSAIEAALKLRSILAPHPALSPRSGERGRGEGKFNAGLIKKVVVECFDVAVDIIGKEKEKWSPLTRETADHSMPYLVAVALLDGNVTLNQYSKKRFLDRDVRNLMKRVRVTETSKYSALYPRKLPTRIIIKFNGGDRIEHEIFLPKGYAGRPLTMSQIQEKFDRLSKPHLSPRQMSFLKRKIIQLPRMTSLQKFWQI